MGGCPFAPGATGNVATEDVVKALQKKGEKVVIDLQRLSQARRLLDSLLTENRRSLPKDGSPACAACQFSTRSDGDSTARWASLSLEACS